mgnify:CR=1 FL=1
MSILEIYNKDIFYNYQEGKNLLDILQDSGEIIESPCGGKGYCGKCKVQIFKGNLDKPTEEELKHLSKKEIGKGIRLSCFVYPKGDICVKLLYEEEKNYKALSDGYIPEIELNPIIHKEVITLEKPTLENNISYEEILKKSIGRKLYYDNTEFLKALANVYREEKATLLY